MTISFTKKLEYITNSLIPQHIKDNHPKYVDFIKVYLRFLDTNYITKILSIIENTNTTTIWDELLDDYLYMYFNNIIDVDKFELTTANKQIFLTLSKFINNLKGNKKSIDFLFKSLSDFRIADSAGDIDVDKVAITYEENEEWWSTLTTNFHDSTQLHDGSTNYVPNRARPFTYRFTVDNEREAITDLIDNVHPAGFSREFLTEISFSDDQTISEETEVRSTTRIFYNQDNTAWLHDSSGLHSGTTEESILE